MQIHGNSVQVVQKHGITGQVCRSRVLLVKSGEAMYCWASVQKQDFAGQACYCRASVQKKGIAGQMYRRRVLIDKSAEAV